MEQTMTCFVCEYGWILIGKVTSTEKNVVILEDAAVVRAWSNGRGIGGISKEKYKDEYILDEVGTVAIAGDKILFSIPCEW